MADRRRGVVSAAAATRWRSARRTCSTCSRTATTTVNSFNGIQTFPSQSPFGMNGRALYARIGVDVLSAIGSRTRACLSQPAEYPRSSPTTCAAGLPPAARPGAAPVRGGADPLTLYAQLSPRSRYLRFFSAMPIAPDPLMQMLACVDYRRIARR